MTANIIATRKQCSNQVLLVTFPLTKNEEEKSEQGGTNLDVLRKFANQDSSYALPVACLKGSMLDAHVRFVNKKYENEEKEPPTLVTYHCNDFTYEEFGTVAKILNCSYIQQAELSKHAACIDYFGPFTNEKLLVNLAIKHDGEEKKEEDSATEKNCKQFVQSANTTKAESLFPAEKKIKSKPSTPVEEDFGVIVCENESRTKVVYEVAKTLGFSNYVPFKLAFVRGVLLHGYLDNVSVPLSTAELLVGDYNHIFGLQNVGELRQSSQAHACTVNDYQTKYNYFAQENPPGWDDEKGTLYPRPDLSDSEMDDYHDENWHVEEEHLLAFQKQPRGLELKLALGEWYPRSRLTGYVLGTAYSEAYDHSGPRSLCEFDPLSDFVGESASDEKTGRLFHRDEAGKATFTAEEAKAASAYIASMDLDGRVMAAAQNKKFELTQELKEVNDYYCNEST